MCTSGHMPFLLLTAVQLLSLPAGPGYVDMGSVTCPVVGCLQSRTVGNSTVVNYPILCIAMQFPWEVMCPGDVCVLLWTPLGLVAVVVPVLGPCLPCSLSCVSLSCSRGSGLPTVPEQWNYKPQPL